LLRLNHGVRNIFPAQILGRSERYLNLHVSMETASVQRLVSVSALLILLYFSFGIMIPENLFFVRSWALSTRFEFNIKEIIANSTREVYCMFPLNEDGSFFNEKYRNFPIARFAHILPSGLWSLIMPFQFSSWFRKRYPQYHRLSGYVFFLCDIIMSIGLVDIIVNNLMFSLHYNLEYYLALVAGVWFVITGFSAWYFAYTKSFALHKRWIIRHACIGNGVHLQRVFVGLFSSIARLPGLFEDTCSSSFHQWVFLIAGFAAFVLAVVVAEIYLQCLADKTVQITKKIQ
jgi:hypothetical protein